MDKKVGDTTKIPQTSFSAREARNVLNLRKDPAATKKSK